jgi:hypothetical protein
MLDVEAALVESLTTNFTAARVLTELPANLADVLPVIEVTRIGGPRVGLLDVATVDIDCYHATRQTARTLAYDVVAALLALRGKPVTGGVISRVDILSGPNFRPYDNTTLRRFGLTCQLTVPPRS